MYRRPTTTERPSSGNGSTQAEAHSGPLHPCGKQQHVPRAVGDARSWSLSQEEEDAGRSGG
jgi:hypothetical protein